MNPIITQATFNVFKVGMFCFLLIFSSACTQDKAQNNFEDQALRAPAGIRELNASGNHPDDGEQDDDDWRTAPKFSGIFRISTAAFPNPLAFNSTFEIQIYTALNGIDGLYIYAFQLPSDLEVLNPILVLQYNLQPGLQSIRFSPREFAQSGQTGPNSGLYRLIFFNGRNEVISYGDIQVK